MKITIGTISFIVSVEDNPTVKALLNKLPFTIIMKELNGNEKYFFFNESLPNKPIIPPTIQEGDLMLYENNCLVLFYKSFSTSYSYTIIGHIKNVVGLKEALGKGDIKVKFER